MYSVLKPICGMYMDVCFGCLAVAIEGGHLLFAMPPNSNEVFFFSVVQPSVNPPTALTAALGICCQTTFKSQVLGDIAVRSLSAHSR